MRIILLFAFILVHTSLLSEPAKAIGVDSASHGLLYGGRVVRRYGSDDMYRLRSRGFPEDSNPKDPNPKSANPKEVNPKAKVAKGKEGDNKNDKDAKPKTKPKDKNQQKDVVPGDDTEATDTTIDQEQDQVQEQGLPGGTPVVATDGMSGPAVAGLSVVGGVFVLVAGLFAFSQRRKNKEMTKSIVSTSAKAWEQQNSVYEKMEDETKPIGSYTVIATYTPTLADELDIQPGDKVTVLVEYDDGWVQGINETRGGTKGVFPRHCVDMNHITSNKNNKRSSSMGGYAEGYTEVDLN